MSADLGFSRESIDQRHKEIMDVADAYGFNSVHRLGFPAMRLDTVSMLDLVDSIGNVLQTTGAETIYIPFRNDAHTDHGAVFDASVACTKVFRYPSIKSVIAYETISETEFGLKPENTGFKPNLFIDINGHLDQKIEIMVNKLNLVSREEFEIQKKIIEKLKRDLIKLRTKKKRSTRARRS